jgi:hypothetical protein
MLVELECYVFFSLYYFHSNSERITTTCNSLSLFFCELLVIMGYQISHFKGSDCVSLLSSRLLAVIIIISVDPSLPTN